MEKVEITKSKYAFYMPILLLIILFIGCQEIHQNGNTDDNSESIDRLNEQKLTLPAEAKGVFVGEEPASIMKVGNQTIQIPPIKHRLEISGNSIVLQQVSDGETVKSNGNYDIISEDEVSIVVVANLIDDKYNQDYTPTLRFIKDSKSWFLEGTAGSEGCSLKKQG